MDSEDIPSNFVAMMNKILEEWRFSGRDERLNLVYYFRYFFDVIRKDMCLKSQLIIDAENFIAENNMNKTMINFCQAILSDHQNLKIEKPIMYIAMRGTPKNNHEMVIQLRSMLPKECLKVLQQFPNYRQAAKINPVLRSLLMRQTSSFRRDEKSDLHEFAIEIYEEFKALDMWIAPNLLLDQLRALKTEDILLDIASNEYHLEIVSSCKYTVCRVMRCFSDIFPTFKTLNDVLSIQLCEDKCDKYLERILYGRNNAV